MKRASYRNGVEWIALNDEPAETDPEAVAGLISVCLLADLFGTDTSSVTDDVLRYRKNLAAQERRDKKTGKV